MPIKLVCLVGLGLLTLFSSCQSAEVEENVSPLFVEVNPIESGIDFQNNLSPTEDLNIITYLYYYNGGGIAAGDVNSDGLIDLYFTSNQGSDALFINEGGLRFRENTLSAGLSIAKDWSSGASFTDIDGDGDLDLYVNKVSGVGGLSGRNELYLNDGAGSFSESAETFGLAFTGLSTQTAFIDFDGDGDLDAYQLNHSTHDTERRIDTVMRSSASAIAGDRLYLQNDEGLFEDKTNQSGVYQSRLGYGLGLVAADFTGDFYPDLYVSNDFSENDYFYLNQGGGRFKESVADFMNVTSKFSMGSVAADINSDGRLDLLTLDMRPSIDSVRKSSAGGSDPSQFARQRRLGFVDQQARNVFHVSSDKVWSEQAIAYGIHSSDWSWAPVIADFNLDGRQDIFIANGIWRRPNDLDYLKFSSAQAIQRQASNLELARLMPPGLVPNHLYLGSNELPFENVAAPSGLGKAGSTTAALALDLDNDGDLDLVTNNVNAPAAIFENTTLQPGDSLASIVTIQLTGPTSNPYSIGASLFLETTKGWKRTMSLQPVTGFQSSAISKMVSVALPQGENHVNVQVVWPDGSQAFVKQASGKVHIAASSIASTDTSAAYQTAVKPQPHSALTPVAPFEEDPLLPVVYIPGDSVLKNIEAFFRGISGIEISGSSLLIGRERIEVTATYQDADTVYIASLWAPIEKMWFDTKRKKLKRLQVTPSGLWTSICEQADGTLHFGNVGYNNLLVEHPKQQLELHIADYDRNGETDPIAIRVDEGVRRTLFGLDEIAEQMPTMRKFFTTYLPFSASTFDEMFPKAMSKGAKVLRAETLYSMLYDIERGILTTLEHQNAEESSTTLCVAAGSGRLLIHPMLR